ncbi:MAG TPA: ATP-binding protein [Desulfobacterales bacterium]
MKLAIASGKGGTGKTTLAAALVSVWSRPVVAVDLDVEEPNLHLFLQPEITGRQTATIEVPRVDKSKCTYCGKCAEICRFKAISVLGEVLITFPEMCHGCGGCMAVCPENAVTPANRPLGEILWGKTANAEFWMGRLRVGEAMSPPLMRQVKSRLNESLAGRNADVIIDAPPGVSCPAVNAVMDTDAILLVTEPTPFGFYDLRLAHQAFTPLGIPMGVVINRAGLGDRSVYEYCEEQHLPILGEVPYRRRIATAYAAGMVLSDLETEMHRFFSELADQIQTGAIGNQEVEVD